MLQRAGEAAALVTNQIRERPPRFGHRQRSGSLLAAQDGRHQVVAGVGPRIEEAQEMLGAASVAIPRDVMVACARPLRQGKTALAKLAESPRKSFQHWVLLE